MSKPENQAIAGVHKYLPHFVEHEKMANPWNSGTADVWYSAWPHDLWVEYKFLDKPPSRGFTLALTDLQRLWLARRYRQGRAVAVALLFPAKFGCVLYTHLAWGEHKSKVAAPDTGHIITRSQLADFITQSCTSDAHHSSLIYHGESGAGGLSDRDVWRGHIPHYSEPSA